MVNKYFEKVERVISGFYDIITDQTIKKKEYNDKQGLISGKIEFTDESDLAFLELKNMEEAEKMKYKYHYMDDNKKMIFRYDNAKHHPELETYPHHKHIPDDIIESQEPELIDILTEIQDEIEKKK